MLMKMKSKMEKKNTELSQLCIPYSVALGGMHLVIDGRVQWGRERAVLSHLGRRGWAGGQLILSLQKCVGAPRTGFGAQKNVDSDS